ncbi:diguanylate cyclase [Marinobacter fonticola]|uniref:diguanylate cyclase n=1 Tax=Marinobacter fonticola TaxID=2603215 RepID=UPI001D0DA887|nr:diguanylate cyclase [Marinobacter fonticola]
MALTLLIVAYTQDIAVRELRDRVGVNLQEVSQQVRDQIELNLEERYRDLALASSVLADDVEASRFERVQVMLEELQLTYEDYAWIGLVAMDGEVLFSTDNVLKGENVAHRPWFFETRDRPFLGDVHKALLLDEILSTEDSAPLRLIDIAVPVRDTESGEMLAVLGAHLNWAWARKLESAMLALMENRLDTSLLVISRDSAVLLGSPELSDTTLDTGSVREALAGQTGYDVETWDDGVRYLIGYSQTRDSLNFEGLGWAVLVRMPAASAFEPAQHMRNGIVAAGLVAASLFCFLAWLTARRVSRPLLKMTQEAEAIEVGAKNSDIKLRDDFEEVSVLSRALNRLVRGLKSKEKELRKLNMTLEQRVAARTEDLESVNRALREEMATREVLRSEREQMIQQLKNLANTDGLTSISNRRHFFEEGEQLLKRVARRETKAAMILFDVDHFKRINDTYGHGVGDAALKHLVGLAKQAIRDVDLLARIGGEEFALLLEDESGENAWDIAERLRTMVETMPLEIPGGEVRMTISLGIARIGDCEIPSLDLLLAHADRALYSAKEGGRNRIEQASACGPSPEGYMPGASKGETSGKKKPLG